MWKMTLMRRIWKMSIHKMRGNVTGGWRSRKIMEGWMMQIHCYMLIGGMSV